MPALSATRSPPQHRVAARCRTADAERAV